MDAHPGMCNTYRINSLSLAVCHGVHRSDILVGCRYHSVTCEEGWRGSTAGSFLHHMGASADAGKVNILGISDMPFSRRIYSKMQLGKLKSMPHESQTV